MKKLQSILITIALVLLATPCFAWTLSWEAVSNADGYRVSYGEMPDPTTAPPVFADADTGTNLLFNLDSAGFTVGTRYEMYIQAYANTDGGGIAYTGHSTHLRWTYPSPPGMIEYMAPPQNPVINP